MAENTTVAVEATEARFRVLKHQPSGLGFEADGTGRWPADQFTFRLRDEGAIRVLEHLNDPGVPEGVVPGQTPGWPVDAISGRLLDLEPTERERLAEIALDAATAPDPVAAAAAPSDEE